MMAQLQHHSQGHTPLPRGPLLPLCIQEVPPGKGSMPLGMVLQLSHHLGEDATVFVEHLPDHESYLAAIDHMRKVGEAAGVPIK